MRNRTPSENPGTLVAIIVAARRAGNRELEREMKRDLEREFGVKLSFTHAGRLADEKGVDHAK